jgi:hypothetical protein
MVVCISLVPNSDLILLLDHALDLTQVSSYLRAFFFLVHFTVDLVLDFLLVLNGAFYVFRLPMIFFPFRKL